MVAQSRGNKKTEWLQGGLLLLDSTLTPVYVGGDAARILLYPNGGGPSPSAALLRERVAELTPPDDTSRSWSTEFFSGRRRYRCQGIHLEASSHVANPPVMAMLIERSVDEAVGSSRLPELYKLAPREREAVLYLLDGLDSHEIAARLGIVEDSLKSLFARVMRKMDVTTRSGILGRYIARSAGFSAARPGAAAPVVDRALPRK